MSEAAPARRSAWIERFIAELGTARMSPHTLTNYRRDLDALNTFCDSNGLKEWIQMDSQHVRLFAARQHAGGLGPRSIQRRLSAIRSFFDFILRVQEDAVRSAELPGKVLLSNPARDVRAPKSAKRLPHTADADQMARLLDFRPQGTLEIRDKAIIELFYSSGLRLQELVSLDLQDLDLPDQTVRVTGKGQKTRIVPVGRHAVTALKAWLGQRPTLPTAGGRAVFVSGSGRRLGVRAVQKRIDYWAKRRGLGLKLHPHLFRHSFATHLLESSGDLRGVQELLGHADIATTQIYTHLDFQHLARIYDASHPRARKKS